MKTLLAAMLSLFAAQAHAHALEADLDGNASALQASEMQPASKNVAKPSSRKLARPSAESRRT